MCKRNRTECGALRAARLSMLIFAAALIAPDAYSDTTPGAAQEDSVLVVTRQALSDASDAAAGEEALSPIAADSDRTPDLADLVEAHVATLPGSPPVIGGLLGQSFLRHFQVTIDAERAVMHLRPVRP